MIGQRRWGFEAALGVALAAGTWVATGLLVRTWPLERLPTWDAAGNGWGAVELLAALADGRIVDFVVRLNAQDTWPFGFSLAMLPFVALGGGSFESATLLPALAFALVPALLVVLAGEIERDVRGLGAGLVAGALWLVSPLPRALATVALRETAGAALGVAALAAYLRARRLGTLGAWRLAAFLLLALVFTKYNYFLLTGMAVGLHALLELSGEQRKGVARDAWRRIARDGWRSPARWAAAMVGISAAALAFGQNPGNFLYACLVVATATLLSRRWRSLLRPRAALSRLAPAARGLIEWLVVPVWIWSLSPRPIHPRSFIAFLRNRPGELPVASADALGFYPRSLFAHFLAPAAVGWAVVGLAVVGLVALARRPGAGRALASSVGIGAMALVLHPMKQDRFLATLAPLLFLLAGVALVRLVAAAPLRAEVARGVTLVALGFALVAVPGAAARAGALARLESDHRLLSVSPDLLPALTAAAFWASEAEGRRVAFVGGFNEVSESAVRWEAWRGYGGATDWAAPLRGLDGGSSPAEIERRLAGWLAGQRPHRIVALVPSPGSAWAGDADYRRYNAWQGVALDALRRRPGWRVVVERPLPVRGLDLLVLDADRP